MQYVLSLEDSLVRDSQPLSLIDLNLAQKVDLFSENTRRRVSRDAKEKQMLSRPLRRYHGQELRFILI